jgi:hypothetical protein
MSQDDERNFYNSLIVMNAITKRPATKAEPITGLDKVRVMLREALDDYENLELDGYQNLTVEAYMALNDYVGKTPSELTLRDFTEWFERTSDFSADDFQPFNELCVFSPALRYHCLGDNNTKGCAFYGSWATIEIIKQLVAPMLGDECDNLYIYTFNPETQTFEDAGSAELYNNQWYSPQDTEPTGL